MDEMMRRRQRDVNITPIERWTMLLRAGNPTWSAAFEPGMPLHGCILLHGIPKESESHHCLVYGRHFERIRAGTHYSTGKPLSNRQERRIAAEKRSKELKEQQLLNRFTSQYGTGAMGDATRPNFLTTLQRVSSKLSKQRNRAIERAIKHNSGISFKLGPAGYFIWNGSHHINYKDLSHMCNALGVARALEYHRSCKVEAINL